jgi:flagellar hook assembly protein FlgD
VYIQTQDLNIIVYPNPFNPSTIISFSVTQTLSFVTLSVYNIKGQKIKNLVNEVLTQGSHTVLWDGKNNNGNEVSSGLYLCRLRIGDQVITRKLMMMK